MRITRQGLRQARDGGPIYAIGYATSAIQVALRTENLSEFARQNLENCLEVLLTSDKDCPVCPECQRQLKHESGCPVLKSILQEGATIILDEESAKRIEEEEFDEDGHMVQGMDMPWFDLNEAIRDGSQS